MIQLTDPSGVTRKLDENDISIIFFSAFLSPPKAKSNVVYAGQIRSFRESLDTAVATVSALVPLVKLTLPKGGASQTARPIWIAKAYITETQATKDGGCKVTIKGQKGPVFVTESKAVVDAAAGL